MHDTVNKKLSEIIANNNLKPEYMISSPQDTNIKVDNKEVINFCANNYLGLANHPEIKKASIEAINHYGVGMASVRFICGTNVLHKELEEKTAKFVGTESSVVFASCFDANAAIFEVLLSQDDAIISDQLNHASIIDGVRLCKAKRFRYLHRDMTSLKEQCELALQAGCKNKIIVTDGVFSMDGTIAPLPEIVKIAKSYNALVMVDDCHGTGVIGENGKGSPEFTNSFGEIDIITGTYGKALGGSAGGFIACSAEIAKIIKQTARPYLFSNALAPPIVAASITALDILQRDKAILHKLQNNAKKIRSGIKSIGFDVLGENTAIIPAMFYDSKKAEDASKVLKENNILAVNFSYPVVPIGKARIRLQASAGHTDEHIASLMRSFEIIWNM